MISHIVIRSRANAALKRVRFVRAGKAPGTLLLEGERLVSDAVSAGLCLDLLLLAEERADLADALGAGASEVRLVQGDLLEQVSALETSPGVLALAPAPPARALDDLRPGPRSLYLVAAGVADPGNLGALARSGEAAGVEALIVLAGGARPWSPKALRGSMGSLLRLAVVEAEHPGELAAALARDAVRSVVATPRGGAAFDTFDWSGPLALWIGGETGGMPEIAGLEPVTIPMAGAVESLNVTVAASLLLFAAGRAREELR